MKRFDKRLRAILGTDARAEFTVETRGFPSRTWRATVYWSDAQGRRFVAFDNFSDLKTEEMRFFEFAKRIKRESDTLFTKAAGNAD
jgi:hypothetical protein